MKLEKALIAALLVLVYLCPFIGYSISQNANNTKVEVEFIDSDSFTDIRNGVISSSKREAYVLKTIKQSIVKTASKSLPDGYTLKMRVTDIDLAGDQQPIPPSFGNYRVFRDVYAPRIAFDYTIVDASEVIVAEGSSNLTDLAYRNNLKVALSSDKTAAYVNDLVSNWVHGDMRRMVKNR